MTFIFFVIAFLYSMVGFGGGSSYVAILALTDCSYAMIPPLALFCNIIVVSGSAFHFIKNGHYSIIQSWPLLVCSVPMAFFGAMISITEQLFFTLLGISLLAAGSKLLFFDRHKTAHYNTEKLSIGWTMFIGVFLGLLSGMVGIGGGIFLAPILLFLQWGTPKQIAATAAVFILVNSLSGLTGQLIKHTDYSIFLPYWPIFVAVLCGGQLGSVFGAGHAPQRWIMKCTATLVTIVGMRVFIQALIVK